MESGQQAFTDECALTGATDASDERQAAARETNRKVFQIVFGSMLECEPWPGAFDWPALATRRKCLVSAKAFTGD